LGLCPPQPVSLLGHTRCPSPLLSIHKHFPV
jgi:hypothetical protein